VSGSPDCQVLVVGAGPPLVRPDGYVAARGRPGDMATVTGYLRDLLGEPAENAR